jgi:hypothetical protein
VRPARAVSPARAARVAPAAHPASAANPGNPGSPGNLANRAAPATSARRPLRRSRHLLAHQRVQPPTVRHAFQLVLTAVSERAP